MSFIDFVKDAGEKLFGRGKAKETMDQAKAAPADEAAVKAANASLGPNQRIAGWRLWPEADFPRTHTFKIKRDRVRTWAAVDGAGAAGGQPGG